jgi:pyrroline-5-carboxylate reductase
MALRRAWPGALVIGVDASDVIEAAMRLHAIDVGSADLTIAGGADLVVLAGGPDENARVLPYLADAIAGEAVVLALGGGDRVGELARSLPSRLPVVAGLPSIELRGTGIHAASPGLVQGRVWTFAPVTAAHEDMERMSGLVRAIGGEPDTESPSA